MYFYTEVPDSLLASLKPRKKQICVLELLWVVLPVIVWPSLLQDAYLVVHEDNEAARGGIVKGMSRHWDLNALLALLWGAFSELRCKLWAERITSLDNPADCLTKAGIEDTRTCLMQQTSLTRSSGPVFSRGFRASWPREACRLGAMLSLSLNWTLRALRANSLEVLLIITFGQRLVSALPLAQAGCVPLPPPSCLFKLSRWLNKFAFASFLHQEAP